VSSVEPLWEIPERHALLFAFLEKSLDHFTFCATMTIIHHCCAPRLWTFRTIQ
jgi:hypothetical protein